MVPACMFTLQHVDCVGIDIMRVDIDSLTHRLSLAYTQAISCTSCMEWNTISEKFDARRAAERTRFGVVALLSGTVLSRCVSL